MFVETVIPILHVKTVMIIASQSQFELDAAVHFFLNSKSPSTSAPILS